MTNQISHLLAQGSTMTIQGVPKEQPSCNAAVTHEIMLGRCKIGLHDVDHVSKNEPQFQDRPANGTRGLCHDFHGMFLTFWCRHNMGCGKVLEKYVNPKSCRSTASLRQVVSLFFGALCAGAR